MAQPAVSRPGKRQRQREDTHARIFEAAVAEFVREGVAGAQIPRIASQAGVARGTFYFHFPTKEHVLIELSERLEGTAVESLRSLRGTEYSLSDTMERLMDVVQRVDGMLGESNLLREVLALQVRMGAEADPQAAHTDVRSELTHHLAHAMERGELRGDVEPERLATVVLTSLFGLLVAGKSGEVGPRAEFRLLIEMLLDGMRAGAARPGVG